MLKYKYVKIFNISLYKHQSILIFKLELNICLYNTIYLYKKFNFYPFDPDGSHMLVSEIKPCKSK